jgi:ATP-dependent protease Clp ATPase subunit
MDGAICTWCRRPPSEVTKLVAGPNTYICDACVTAASSVGAGTLKKAPLKLAKTGLLQRCTFCRKRPSGMRVVVTGPDANICSECLRVCREIMDLPVA